MTITLEQVPWVCQGDPGIKSARMLTDSYSVCRADSVHLPRVPLGPVYCTGSAPAALAGTASRNTGSALQSSRSMRLDRTRFSDIEGKRHSFSLQVRITTAVVCQAFNSPNCWAGLGCSLPTHSSCSRHQMGLWLSGSTGTRDDSLQ